MATTLQAYLPNLGKFTVMQFVTPNLRLTPEAAREMSLAQAILRKGTEPILAETVVVTPAGGISAIDVQGALQELDAEKADAAATAAALAGKQPLDATLTALAGLTTAADKLSYWSGVDVAALTDFTSFARTLLDDPDAATMRATLGLGTLATQNGTFSGTSSGTNTGDQTITLTGDVTGSGAGSFAATVGANAITYAKMQDVSAASVLLGRGSAAGAGDPQEITLGSGLTMTGTTLSAAGGGGGSGTVTSVSVASANGFAGTVATPSVTPAITLTTTITGLLKGNGTAMSAAVADTDYLAPGGALGTPASATLTNATGLPIATGVSGLAAGVAAFLAAPNSANMRTMITDETGTGANVFATSPALVTPDIGAATGTSLTTTGSQVSSGGGFGYTTGAGGTVTQSSSKTTGVTLNKLCGTITLSNASLASQNTASFVLTNSTIAADDLVLVLHNSVGTMGAYNFAQTPANGSVTIAVRNISAASLGEAIVLRFAVIKGVTA